MPDASAFGSHVRTSNFSAKNQVAEFPASPYLATDQFVGVCFESASERSSRFGK